jgi:hypothetical protein
LADNYLNTGRKQRELGGGQNKQTGTVNRRDRADRRTEGQARQNRQDLDSLWGRTGSRQNDKLDGQGDNALCWVGACGQAGFGSDPVGGFWHRNGRGLHPINRTTPIIPVDPRQQLPGYSLHCTLLMHCFHILYTYLHT